MPWNIFINAKTVSYVRHKLLLLLFVTLLLSDTCHKYIVGSSCVYNRSMRSLLLANFLIG